MSALIMVAVVALAIYTNVPTKITSTDVAVFTELGLERPFEPQTFDQELALIRKVQYVVFKRAPLSVVGIPEFESREPIDLMRYGKGLCYDRSRTFDKALSYLGLETRHVYLLYRDGRSFWGALIHYGQPSHAVTEVKTSRGWMFVDSNTEWIALTRQGEPVSADEVWQRYAEFDHAPHYLAAPWWALRGVYSRKGQFYGAGVMFPELNWPDFARWLVSGK